MTQRRYHDFVMATLHADAHKILRHVFGYNTFRAGQLEIIEQVTRGSNALVLMPTGGGKSLCFQMPALMRAGMQGLGLTPEVFWALTPAELLMMLGDSAGPAPMGRDRLEALAARFPDVTLEGDGNGRV